MEKKGGGGGGEGGSLCSKRLAYLAPFSVSKYLRNVGYVARSRPSTFFFFPFSFSRSCSRDAAPFRDKSCIREIPRMGTLNVLTGRKVLGTCIPSAPTELRVRSSRLERAPLSFILSLSLFPSSHLFSATSLAREKRKATLGRNEEETGGRCDVGGGGRLTSCCGCVLHASLVQESQGRFLIRDSWHLARKEQRDLNADSLRETSERCSNLIELIDHPNLLDR